MPEPDWPITATPGICGGRPLIRATRIWPGCVWSFFEVGGVEAVREAYPDLTREQVMAAIGYIIGKNSKKWRRKNTFQSMREEDV